MKKMLLLVMMTALCLTLCGCAEKPLVPAQDVAQAILGSQAFAPEMTQLPEKKMIKALDLADGEYAEAVMHLDASRVTAEAVVVVTAQAGKEADVEKKLTAYRDSVLEQYRTYQPDEVPKLEAAKVLRRGAQCVLVIASDQPAAKAACENAWK